MTFTADSKRVMRVVPAAASVTGKARPVEQITLVVLHSAETPEGPLTASSVANYFAGGSGGRPASTHYVVDATNTLQCLPELRISFGAKGYNWSGLHIEMAGRASQTAAQWADGYSKKMIDTQLVPLLADILVRHRERICLKWLTAAMLTDQLRKGITPSGVTTHANCSAAYAALGLKTSGHTDPGKGFPAAATFAAAATLALRTP